MAVAAEARASLVAWSRHDRLVEEEEEEGELSHRSLMDARVGLTNSSKAEMAESSQRVFTRLFGTRGAVTRLVGGGREGVQGDTSLFQRKMSTLDTSL